MRHAPAPTVGLTEIVGRCNRKSDQSTRDAFTKALSSLVALEEQYRIAGEKGTLGEFARTFKASTIDISDENLRRLYAGRMVPETSSGHTFYVGIRDAAGGRCCLCDARDATSLDHYLPKELFAPLSFLPLNLLPACEKCNGYKSTHLATEREEEFFHPYFDDLRANQWLSARLQNDASGFRPSLEFEVADLGSNNETVHRRIKYQFRRMRLGGNYKRFAANELAELRSLLIRQHTANPSRPPAVRNYLVDMANSLAQTHSRNYWRAVSYKAWAGSPWFYSGGYAQALQ